MRLTLLAALVLWIGGIPARAQSVKAADSLSPADLGAIKYVFEATPHNGDLVVFRRDDYFDGKLKTRNESIYGHGAYEQGKTETLAVVLIDWSFFGSFKEPDKHGPYELKYPNGGLRVDNYRRKSWGNVGKGGASIVFTSTQADRPQEWKMEFSILTESYASLKQRFPDLSPLEKDRSWVTNEETKF